MTAAPTHSRADSNRDEFTRRMMSNLDGGKDAEIAALQARVEDLTKALQLARNRIEYLGQFGHERHRQHDEKEVFPAIDKALSMPLEERGSK